MWERASALEQGEVHMRRSLVAGSVLMFALALLASPSTASAQGAAPRVDDRVDGASFQVRLRDIQARTDEMKDGLRRVHAALQAMAERTGGSPLASPVDVSFRNEMSGAFRLRHALFVLDGVVQLNRADDGPLAEQPALPVFTGPLAPGDHTLQAVLRFQGSGQGVLTYLQAYTFDVTSSHSFTTLDGRRLTVTAAAVERGDVTTPFELRPSVVWTERAGAK
jgi:hypothetical protein